MKRILSFMLVGVLMFSLAGCFNVVDEPDPDPNPDPRSIYSLILLECQKCNYSVAWDMATSIIPSKSREHAFKIILFQAGIHSLDIGLVIHRNTSYLM